MGRYGKPEEKEVFADLLWSFAPSKGWSGRNALSNDGTLRKGRRTMGRLELSRQRHPVTVDVLQVPIAAVVPQVAERAAVSLECGLETILSRIVAIKARPFIRIRRLGQRSEPRLVFKLFSASASTDPSLRTSVEGAGNIGGCRVPAAIQPLDQADAARTRIASCHLPRDLGCWGPHADSHNLMQTPQSAWHSHR